MSRHSNGKQPAYGGCDDEAYKQTYDGSYSGSYGGSRNGASGGNSELPYRNDSSSRQAYGSQSSSRDWQRIEASRDDRAGLSYLTDDYSDKPATQSWTNRAPDERFGVRPTKAATAPPGGADRFDPYRTSMQEHRDRERDNGTYGPPGTPFYDRSVDYHAKGEAADRNDEKWRQGNPLERPARAREAADCYKDEREARIEMQQAYVGYDELAGFNGHRTRIRVCGGRMSELDKKSDRNPNRGTLRQEEKYRKRLEREEMERQARARKEAEAGSGRQRR
ncbi:hypothetical protein G7Z17_g4131 [Cylindrodendrum hubeiense]|uniref:Uncharacterized protein n=1 Tax=Cylindrodendrum hubeiense TaxID=595255 RepID=A0A9P5HFH5_9HYPO|nr:hypothetical protein G7Z17_g4131 [Cylindrodendrum hubeiense]